MHTSFSRMNVTGLSVGIVCAALTISSALLVVSPSARAQAVDSCQALSDISVILSVATEQFYDKTYNGLNWRQEISDAVEATACDDTPLDVTRRANALLSRLEASHTAVYSQQELDYWGLNSLFHFDGLDGYTLPFPGIWSVEQNGRWFASQILNGSTAEQAGIQVGDELISLNGQAFAPVAFIEGDNQLEISSDGNTRRQVTVAAPVQSVMRAFVDASAASANIYTVQGDQGEKTVGYYRIWAARDQIQRNFQDEIDRFVTEDVDGVIVDLRGGFGGTSEDYLAPIRFALGQRELPVYFLIDESVRSGKELLAGVVRRDELGTLLGATTAGQYLSGRMNRLLNDRYFLYVAVGTFPAPTTGEIEGVGVSPDIQVQTCTQYCAGSDPLLEQALQEI